VPSDEEKRLHIINKALGMIAPAGYWFREVLERIWHAKDEAEAVEVAIAARKFLTKAEMTGPASPPKAISEEDGCPMCHDPECTSDHK
jgi:hypothetical protein